MDARDRTKQFRKIVRELKSLTSSPQPQKTEKPATSRQEDGGADIFERQLKSVSGLNNAIKDELADLEKTVEDSSIFSENATSVGEISLLIKQNLQKAMNQVEAAAELAPPPCRQKSEANRNALAKIKADLVTSTEVFQRLLAKRTEKQQKVTVRRQKFSSQSSIVPRDLSRFGQASFAAEQDEAPRSPAQPRGHLLHPQGSLLQPQAQLTEQAQSSRASTFLRERLEATQIVEQTISELGTMYQRLAAIVAVQDEQCHRIDTNTEAAAGDIEAGHAQVEKFSASVTGNRFLAAKVFTMLVFISAIFFLFFK